MKFNLDFNIETSYDRRDFIASKDLSNLTQKEIELCSNYILYGKDIDKTSVVDRKEVYIKPKYSSYSKKEPISLDALLESPTFNESLLNQKPTIYKKIKPTIDRNKRIIQNIPGMQELWTQIDKIQNTLDENTGKKEHLENTPILSQKQIYYLKHYLIDLRRQQYYLMDSLSDTFAPPQNKGKYFTNIIDTQMNYKVFPRGVMKEKNDIFFMKPYLDKESKAISSDSELEQVKKSNKPYFNFLDKNHIYQLILFYWDIKITVEQLPDSPLHNLLWTLDFYIDKANLNEQQKLIVRDKKLRVLNKEISQHLMKELNVYHQENYISTIWNKITQQIADAAEFNYEEWLSKDYDKAWKICNTCGEKLLKDPRNFVRKTKAPDGLTNCCKKCDKKRRQKK